MDAIDVEVTGLKEVQAMLDHLSKQAGDRCIRKALKAGALVEQAAITERAPVKDTTGGILPDGALKSDIEIHFKRDDQGIQQAIVGPGKYTAHAARWVEYGHRLVTGGYNKLIKFGKHAGKTRGPGQVIGEVKEHPFIRPGYEQSRQAVLDAITTTLKTEVTKESKKAKR
jgi:HK97 gp10 family phage protein